MLALIERDYVERLAYVPVSEPEAIARIHRLADVISEEYMYAENGEEDGPQAVARMHFRAAQRNDARLRETLEPFAKLRPVVDNGVPIQET